MVAFAHGFGWKPDVPDHRDLKYALSLPLKAALAPRVDLRSADWSSPYDQKKSNSCTGHAIAFLYEAARCHKKLKPMWVPSGCFVYWNERDIEGSTQQDNGGYIRDGMKSINVVGICADDIWPLSQGVLARPTQDAFDAAQPYHAVQYSSVSRSLAEIKGCLFEGLPIVFGFTVYESIQNAEHTGDIPFPGAREELLGAHAVVAVGYDDATQRFLLRNSWGESWGNAGYGTIPYAYLLERDLSDDFWCLRLVTPSLARQ